MPDATTTDPPLGRNDDGDPKTSQESQAEQQAVVRAAADQAAEKRVEQDVEAYEAEVEQAPTGEKSKPDEPLQSAGNTGTLKEWEDSPVGKAYIAAVDGERQTTPDDDSTSRRSRRSR